MMGRGVSRPAKRPPKKSSKKAKKKATKKAKKGEQRRAAGGEPAAPVWRREARSGRRETANGNGIGAGADPAQAGPPR